MKKFFADMLFAAVIGVVILTGWRLMDPHFQQKPGAGPVQSVDGVERLEVGPRGILQAELRDVRDCQDEQAAEIDRLREEVAKLQAELATAH